MRPIEKETYNTLVHLLKGTFTKKVRDRSVLEKNAVVMFWRNKDNLTLDRVNNKDILKHYGKEILLRSSIAKQVVKKMEQTHGGGARAIAYSLKEKYSCISEPTVRGVLSKNKTHGEVFATFTNKAPLKSINAKRVFERVQVDLLRMKEVAFQNKSYRYILTAVDVFSRFVFLKPLERKSAKCVAKALQDIFIEHGFPEIVQTDNGPEFLGEVKRLLGNKNVKVIKSRPYHPQAQGKVERQNRIIRAKIRYEMSRRRRSGYNWAENLSKVASTINSHHKEVLGYQTPFAVYYGRGSDPNSVREKATVASERCSKRVLSSYWKKHSCSIYKKSYKVLLRYPFKQTRVPYKRYVLKGVILKRGNFYDKYLVKYLNPERKLCKTWVNVENVTSRTAQEEKRRRQKSVETFKSMERKRLHKQKYYIQLHPEKIQDIQDRQSERTERHINEQLSETNSESSYLPDCFASDSRVRILYDPRGIGDCQFAAVSDQLRANGLYINSTRLRNMAVCHIEENFQHYQSFVDGNFKEYLKEMKKDSTYGDNITLIALARELNCQFFVVNSQGENYNRWISNTNHYEPDMQIFTLGYYAEDDGEHYVSVGVADNYLEAFMGRSGSDVFSASFSQAEAERNTKSDNFSETAPSAVNAQESPNEQIDLQVFVEATQDNEEESEQQTGATECTYESRPEESQDEQMDLHVISEDPRATQDIEENSEGQSGTTECTNECRPEADRYSPYLPDLVLKQIIEITIKRFPLMRYTLQRVCRFFEITVQTIGYPSIHVNPFQMEPVPRRISVMRLSRTFGRHSGIMLKVRSILRDSGSHWFRAWLTLYEKENNWYEVRDISWR